MIAITRPVSPKMADCQLTYQERQPIDIALATQQHSDYEDALKRLGCQIVQAPMEPELPDSVFVEDCAVVFDELAIITNPSAASRKPELDTIVEMLHPHRPLHFILPPGTLDGGDVLVIGKQIWIGLSGRSNQAAAEQVEALLQPHGYQVQAVEVKGCLHLKSAVSQVKTDTLLLNPAWVDAAHFEGFKIIETFPDEPHAANALMIGESVIYPVDYLLTAMLLADKGIELLLVDCSEVIKAEGGVTCCSLVFSGKRGS
ncbi:MAG TPA: dimethylargininase [Bacteroidetes bacterium]|nr:dimethylargininase [Bacteroidota bacterium]